MTEGKANILLTTVHADDCHEW